MTKSIPISQIVLEFFSNVVTHAYPSFYAVKVYSAFLLYEAVLAMINPIGITVYGLPLKHKNNLRLKYNCNALSCWYITLVLGIGCYYFNVIDFPRIVNKEFGAFITVSAIAGNIVSFAIYFGAIITNNTHRMTNNFIHDFFMGAWLNPRVFNLDLKLFAEVRVSWALLFFITFSCAVSLYEELGRVPWNMCIILIAHFLYSNACQKGEECIPFTWDIFYEKWGWMIIFWNFCGVPFVYTAQSLYLLHYYRRSEDTNIVTCVCILLTYLYAYYVFDTCNSQKTRFRMQLRNEKNKKNNKDDEVVDVRRKWAFPQFKYGVLENPKYIKTEAGSCLLVDGWHKYARKLHYTADIVMALCWGLACGFDSFLPYYYVSFFTCVLVHRAFRDNARCKEKYGKDWDKYCKQVPYVFIPGIY